jgi:hypothetical protein
LESRKKASKKIHELLNNKAVDNIKTHTELKKLIEIIGPDKSSSRETILLKPTMTSY